MKRIAAIVLAALIVFSPKMAWGAEKTTGVVILMYHHLSYDQEQMNSSTVAPTKFAGDMEWLVKNGYHIVFPSELTAGGVPEKTVCVTFDDGYESNYLLAYPILKRLGIKAEISVITSYIGKEGFLTWDECREMEASGLIEIGSHTHNLHNPDTNGQYVNGSKNGVQKLRKESYRNFKIRVLDDIQKSSDIILEELGHRPVTFAYPYGQKDFNSTKFIRGLFPVTLLTGNKTAGLKHNLYDLTRYGVDMKTDIKEIFLTKDQ